MDIWETSRSREQNIALSPDAQWARLEYFATGSDDDSAVRALVQSTAPPFFNTLRSQSAQLSPLGNGNWLITVTYGRRKVGSVQINFDTMDEKTKIFSAVCDDLTGKPFSNYYPAKDSTGAVQEEIDFGGAIEVKNHNGTVKTEGVEVFIPRFAFTVNIQFGAGFILDGDTVQMMIDKTGMVNSDDIFVTIAGIDFHFNPGELLFLGMQGSQQSGAALFGEDPQWEGGVTMKFVASHNLDNTTIAGVENVNKRGWEYAWVSYEPDDSGKIMLPKTRQVNVDQIYRMDELSPLFFGAVH